MSDIFDDAIGTINSRFGQTLPRLADLPAGSVMATLWGLSITIDADPPTPLLFKACATDKNFAFATNITGQLIVDVTPGGTVPLVPCLTPPERSLTMNQLTATTLTTETKIRFGIMLKINNTDVPITTDDIANAKENGVEFELPSPVTLGSIKDFQDWVQTKFSVSLPKAEDLPKPLDEVVGAMTDIQIAVNKAHIKVPAKAEKVLYTIETSGTLKSEISLIKDQLGVKGIVFGITNETV